MKSGLAKRSLPLILLLTIIALWWLALTAASVCENPGRTLEGEIAK
jgi:hypothetical protein